MADVSGAVGIFMRLLGSCEGYVFAHGGAQQSFAMELGRRDT